MGSTGFSSIASGTDAGDAFDRAQQDGTDERGNEISGTVAVKDYFEMITRTVMSLESGEDLAWELIDNEDPRVREKFGPAGCIEVTPAEDTPHLRRFVFFGWANG